MKEYQKQIDVFTEKRDRKIVTNYCKNFWLNQKEYQKKWKPIQDTIFDPSSRTLPDMMFREGFNIMPRDGGPVFNEEWLRRWKDCMNTTEDKEFVILQNLSKKVESKKTAEETSISLKYQADITWDEMMSGGVFSIDIFGFTIRDYFVFGDSGTWGRYAASDYIFPLDIIGFKPEYEDLFKEKFNLPEEFRENVKKHTPPKYQKWITW